MTVEPAQQERVLVLLPNSKDAERTIAGLSTAGFQCVACRDLVSLCLEIKRGAGAALLTEETLLHDREQCVAAALRDEPSWSNFPLIVLALTSRDPNQLPASRTLNITLVERPLRFLTLRSVVDVVLCFR